MKTKIILTLMTLLIVMKLNAQQDPLYNLYYYNQAMINPAYAGLYKNINLNLISRQQWVGIEGAPVTNTLAVSSSLGDRAGVGGLVVSDQLGINTTTEIQFAFSYKVINARRQSLSFGVQGGIIDYRYDYNKLNIEYIDDADLDLSRTEFQQPNFGAGIFYSHERFYLGFSVPRIMNVVVGDGVTSSTRYMRHFYLSGGLILNNSLHDKVLFKPSFLLRMGPDGNRSLDVNMHALISEVVWVGATLRNFSAAGLNTQFQVSQRLRAGYSFELPTSRLISRNYGTHEVSIMIELSPMTRQQRVVRYF